MVPSADDSINEQQLQNTDAVSRADTLEDGANVQAVLDAPLMNCCSRDDVNNYASESEDGDKSDNAEKICGMISQ